MQPQTTAARCMNCGKDVAEALHFAGTLHCSYCGAAIARSVPVVPPPPPIQKPQHPLEIVTKSNRGPPPPPTARAVANLFCRTCGQSVHAHAAICPHCGCLPAHGGQFCPRCANATHPGSVACVKCGTGFLQLQSPSQYHAPGMIRPTPGSLAPGAALLLSLVLIGLPQMVMGQAIKGVVMLIVAGVLGVLTGRFACLVMWPVGAIDAYCIASKLRRGQPVHQWEFF